MNLSSQTINHLPAIISELLKFFSKQELYKDIKINLEFMWILDTRERDENGSHKGEKFTE